MRSFAPVALVCVALVAPSTAAAQSSDPAPGSPSGSIYQIPLESGRDDAAPGGRVRRDGGGGDVSSPIHSSNGFGSSSTVPGTAAPEPGGATPPPDGAQLEGAAAAPEQSGDAGSPSSKRGIPNPPDTSGRSKPGEADILAGKPTTAVSRAAVQTSPPVSRAVLLLVLGLTVAVGLAVAARLANRRR